MSSRKLFASFILLLFCFTSREVLAQPNWTIDLFHKEEKPPEYVERQLASEKTADKKFTKFRHFIHNNTTHYNYYFNANTKLNTVIENAKLSQQDDYAKLLSYYPYSIENTASQSGELDSVIYKSTTGILIHDLRTDWVDNLYLLVGKSYFYRNDLDSAALTFQFINYNLFPRKKKNDDDDRVIGESSSSAFSNLTIADREKRNLIQKALTLPPSRNDALIWLTRTFIEQEKYGEAAGMINILQHDINLPKRLQDDLSEITGYWFYKQQNYDSAALYLEKSLSNIEDKTTIARQYFLLAQLYELSGSFDKASMYYLKSARKTPDALLDIYSRLNNAKMLRNSSTSEELDKSIATLMNMAKKDKYESYRDIIYYSAGILAMKKPDTIQAVSLFSKSLNKNENNISYKNKAHLVLGKIAYCQKEYKNAADHYDSIDVSVLDQYEDSAETEIRKIVLRKVANLLAIISNEDSLQMVALMSEKDRITLIKKELRKLRKENNPDLNEESSVQQNVLSSSFDNNASGSSDLFDNNSKGEWYFYNNTLKSRGFNDFISKWGKRENVDNWRRLSSFYVTADIDNNGSDPMAESNQEGNKEAADKPEEITFDVLADHIPSTPEKLGQSNQKIISALIDLARLFELELFDYPQAISIYEIYLQRFPDSLAGGEIYLGLHHCYSKLNNVTKANYYKHLIDSLFKDSKYATMLNKPSMLMPEKNNSEVEGLYQQVYDLFMQERYDSALSLKDKADCIYGDHYWTPQLLYIWAVYTAKCVSDSQAIMLLSNIVNNYPESSLKVKAERLIDVLRRRSEIEKYLNDLKINGESEKKKNSVIPEPVPLAQKPLSEKPQPENNLAILPPNVKPKDSVIATVPNEIKQLDKKDSSTSQAGLIQSGPYFWNSNQRYNAVMLFENVEDVFVSESKKVLDKYVSKNNLSKIAVSRDALDSKRALIVFDGFENPENALSFNDKLRKITPAELSWIPASKYFFIIISTDNLRILKNTKDIDNYKKLLKMVFPEKF